MIISEATHVRLHISIIIGYQNDTKTYISHILGIINKNYSNAVTVSEMCLVYDEQTNNAFMNHNNILGLVSEQDQYFHIFMALQYQGQEC